MAKLREAASNSKPSPAKRIWSLWDQPRRDRLVKFVELNLDSREERGKRNGFVEYAQGQGALFDGLKEHLARTDLASARVGDPRKKPALSDPQGRSVSEIAGWPELSAAERADAAAAGPRGDRPRQAG